MLRRIFGPKRDKVIGEWRKVYDEELIDPYASPNIVQVIKSRRVKWVGHVAHMGRVGAYAECWWENLSETDHLEDPGTYGRIILKWIFRK